MLSTDGRDFAERRHLQALGKHTTFKFPRKQLEAALNACQDYEPQIGHNDLLSLMLNHMKIMKAAVV